MCSYPVIFEGTPKSPFSGKLQSEFLKVPCVHIKREKENFEKWG